MGPNPKLFRDLNEPFESNTAADSAVEAFCKDLEAIREKHRIVNVYCVIAGSMVIDGDEQEFMTSVSFGDSLRKLPMTAWAYGTESATNDALMRTIVSKAMKQAKR